MGRYILRRLLLVVPTLFGIILINFVIVQFAPGGPIDQIVATVMAGPMSSTTSISGGGGDSGSGEVAVDTGQSPSTYGLDPALIADLERQFGFDKPAHERFLTMVWNYLQFDFGESYFQDRPVLDSSWNDCLFRFRSGCGRWSRSTAYRFRSESPRRCAMARALTSGPAPMSSWIPA